MSTCAGNGGWCLSVTRDRDARVKERREKGRELLLQGHLDLARAEIQQALHLAGDRPVAAELHADLGVVHHQLREMDAARARYEMALTLADEPIVRARALGNLGAMEHDVRNFDAALAGYEEAIAMFRAMGHEQLEGTFLANMAVLLQEVGATPRARTTYALALERLSLTDPRLEAITRSNLGLLHHELGELEDARTCHEQALILFRRVTDVRSEGLCLGRLAMAHAALGRREDATSFCEQGETLVRATHDWVAASVMELFRAYVELPSALTGERLARARALVSQNDDARTVLRLIEAALARESPATLPVLVIGPDASWVTSPDGATTDLRARRLLQRLLLRLAENHRARPGEGMTLDELRKAGWPGERPLPATALNRVHVALTELRRRGLRSCLQREGTRYRIDPGVRVELR
jgi:tetratricopeptide (TPR) repeat protein